ncbi:HDOD domain-containing protein [Methylomonas methanica]|uniref:Putative signal transduction protein n=1 Tax=Methylomonas methanica (strain DSM 25384 / MC09) TaxID=857087 RepID=F9ZUZ6_METMM|nr:HDOD domain-containing protein [Methylomonas methanica]AEF99429.1 putative signal transduction protein [Methylomonas methanica MC09]
MQSSLFNWTLNAINPQNNGFTPPMDMREAISSIRALPPLPGSAVRIINLISDPKADVDKLAEIIEMDPLLAAQIIRWSTSSLYGYRGKISSVRDAIVRVLGFNFVLDLALGLAVLAPLRAPKAGVIGTRMFWIHALASALLMKKLAQKMPADFNLNAQEVFLAALLHNIGFPLLGHQFPGEFDYLSKLINANPSLSIYNLETFAFGVNHTQIGAWLMSAWSLPRLITDVVYHHHNPFYRGEHCQLTLLTYLNDYLLGQIGIGDAANQTCPEDLWNVLSLEPATGLEIIDSLQDEIVAITDMADMLTQ